MQPPIEASPEHSADDDEGVSTPAGDRDVFSIRMALVVTIADRLGLPVSALMPPVAPPSLEEEAACAASRHEIVSAVEGLPSEADRQLALQLVRGLARATATS